MDLAVIAAAAAALAAAVHGCIFVLESLRWEERGTRRGFGRPPSGPRNGIADTQTGLFTSYGIIASTRGSGNCSRALVAQRNDIIA